MTTWFCDAYASWQKGGNRKRQRPTTTVAAPSDPHAAASNPAVERRRHPLESRMPRPLLDVYDGQSSITAPIEVLGGLAELNSEVAGEILRIDFASFFGRHSCRRAVSSLPIMKRALSCR
jgi:hypothetical protein